jgi:hypothetical protein
LAQDRVVDDHKTGDFSPYLLKSTDRGRSWQSIVGDLPERHLVWRLVQDHVDPRLLFLGTEFGLFFTVDGGGKWVKLGGGVPNIPFRDLAIQRRESDLVGATFGRGFYILDDYTPLREVSEQLLEQEVRLFPTRTARWYVERRPLGGSEKATQGSAFFTSPNPPFGAVFTYYLRKPIRTRKQVRREREKEIAEEGGDTPYPGWEELRKEQLEEDPAIVLTVRDDEGQVVRRLSGPAEAGFHRVAWDLRYPSPAPWKPKEAGRERDGRRNRGFLAAPGAYTVSLAKRVDGVLTELGQRGEFDVVPIRDGTLPGAAPEEVVAFLQRLAGLQAAVLGARSAIDETATRLAGIKEALMRSTVRGSRLDDEARALERRLMELKQRLVGNEQRGRMSDPGPVSISRRLEVAVSGNRQSTYGPTPTHRRSVEIAEEQYAELGRDLERLIEVELPELERELDAAGVPWTPGRVGPYRL